MSDKTGRVLCSTFRYTRGALEDAHADAIYALSPLEPLPDKLQAVADSLPDVGSLPWQTPPALATGEYWYRVGNRYGGSPPLHVESFRVLRRTPRGVWVRDGSQRRFVLDDARKRFAYPSKLEALQSYIARRRCQIKLLEGQLQNARDGLAIATGLKENPK